MSFIDFTGRAIPEKDAPLLDVTFIPKYEKQGVAPTEPAVNDDPTVSISHNTIKNLTPIGGVPPYVYVNPFVTTIATPTVKNGEQNVKGLNQTPVDAEKTLAVMKDA